MIVANGLPLVPVFESTPFVATYHVAQNAGGEIKNEKTMMASRRFIRYSGRGNILHPDNSAIAKNDAGLQMRRFSGKTTAMSTPKDDLVRAVELALAGDWDAAHQLVQPYESDVTAAWIHAVLHKIEGDLGNARYWYRRADRMARVCVSSV
jgi:hypothetical protein